MGLLDQRGPRGEQTGWDDSGGLCPSETGSGLASEKRVFPAVHKESRGRQSDLVSRLVAHCRVLQSCTVSRDLVIQGCAAVKT